MLRFAVLLMVLAAGPVAVQAQQPATAPQIVTLDQDRLYSQSLYGKALEAKSLAATQDLATQNRKIEADLVAEEAALTTQRQTVTPADFARLAAEFDARVERIRAEQEAKVQQLTAARDAGRKQFFDAAVPVLAELMRSSGAYAILNRSSVILSFDTIDITDRAIAALDASLGDGTTPPQPAPPLELIPDPPTPNPTTPNPNPTTPTPAP